MLKEYNGSIWYFDRITINTEIPIDGLKEFLPIDELKSHSLSNRLNIYETSNTARHWKYKTRIDAFDVTDEFVRVLNSYDLALCGIWHIEITKDSAYETFSEAETALFHFHRNIHRKWERKSDLVEGPDNDTYYRGKKLKVSSNNYIRMYPEPALSEDNHIKDKPVTHIEFVLESWTTVKRVLKISHISELGTAEELFTMLEKRYLTEKEINREKIRKTLIEYGADPDRARYRSEMIADVQDLKDWIDREQRNVEHKKHLQPMRRRMTGKARIMDKWDRFIIEKNYKYFLKRN